MESLASDLNSNKPFEANDSAINRKFNPSMSSVDQRDGLPSEDQDGRSINPDNVMLTTKDKNTNSTSDISKDNKSTQESSSHIDPALITTAFTISFDDDSGSKKLGIKDSIKKFAPPKQFTKYSPSKNSSYQESIDTGPTSLPIRSFDHQDHASPFSRSSNHRFSQSSKHSNISDSAAFLIDKMLNNPQEKPRSKTNNKTKMSTIQTPLLDGLVPDEEVELCEEMSDDGTYIVGTDLESDTSRQRIDELFGVVKAAEESILVQMATSSSKKTQKQTIANSANARNSRSSLTSDRKQLNRERQEHINRLAKNPSRSSSVTRQTPTPNTSHQRGSSRHSRNSSCDRESSYKGRTGRRRSTSQSSRSSLKADRQSDGEANSGTRSPSHQLSEEQSTDLSNAIVNTPNMKFNRAFALRRARLGLGEPTRCVNESEITVSIGSPRRNPTTAGRLQNSFCRDDGGRFSLRSRNSFIPGRTSSAQISSRPQGSYQDAYQSRLSSRHLAKPGVPYSNHNSLTCELGEVPLYGCSLGRYNRVSSSRPPAQMSKRSPSDLYDSDLGDYSLSLNRRFNHQLEHECENENRDLRGRDSSPKLGALDNLVISAIGSLSTKVRQSICDILLERAKQLPPENETRLIVEEILPQIADEFGSESKSPTRIEEFDQSIHMDLSRTLKNLKKMEQMVGVIVQINEQLSSPVSVKTKGGSKKSASTLKSSLAGKTGETSASVTTDSGHVDELSPV